MGIYKIQKGQSTLTFRQTRIWLLLLGAMCISFGGFALLLLAQEHLDTTGLHFWATLLLGVGFIGGGLYAMLQPVQFSARFDADRQQLTLKQYRLFGVRSKVYSYQEIRSLTILQHDSDGSAWYMPTLQLENEKAVDLGYGYGLKSDLEDTLESLTQTLRQMPVASVAK